ncbi:MAG TPA: DUF3237 domain-containing protein [Blastocatellia bacterium]|nr:DUF3237 domain-containing protein [Blastocatellia bacterium]
MYEYKIVRVCTFSARSKPDALPEIIGPLAEGIRVNFYTTEGGELSGPRVRGKVRPVGGDWMTIRKDGVGVVDARVTLETHDGALILVIYPGLIDFGEDGYEMILRGELPAQVRLRTAPRFLTSHPEYTWLNRLQCFGVGEYRSATREVVYDVYGIR